MSNDLHVKHRPDTLDGVFGQDEVVMSLGKVLKKGDAHSFLFCGPSGVGKTTLARIIATELGCTGVGLREVDAATHTGIDAMRAITETLSYAAMGTNPTKVLIVDEAHALSKAAWQSLLKSVEEPPDHAYWIFCTTEPAKVPATIRTRCVCYDLALVEDDDIYDLLVGISEEEEFEITEEALSTLARTAAGSPRRAITNLASCSHCKTSKEVSTLLRSSADSTDAIELCRLMIRGQLTWQKAQKILKSLGKVNPEGLRLQTLAYLTSVLMGTKEPKKAAALLGMMDAFATPYPTHDTSMGNYLLSLGEIIFGD